MNKDDNCDDDNYNERDNGCRDKHPVGRMSKRACNGRHSLLNKVYFLRNRSFKVLIDAMRASQNRKPLNRVIVPHEKRFVHVGKNIYVTHKRL